MFENNVFNLNAGIAEALKSLKVLKALVVRLRQYEYSAKLRDIEKNLESAAEHIDYWRNPLPPKGLTPKGKLFYKHLFNYCAAINWENIPGNFNNLLLERKTSLNSVSEFNDASSQQLIDLNSKLAEKENDIREFYKFIEYVIAVKGIKDYLQDVVPGNLVMKCYTRSDIYTFNAAGSRTESLFYQLRFPLNDFVKSMPFFYNEQQPVPDFLQTLPITFMDEKICLLFSILATDGLLAWEDFLNIARVEIELDVKYLFSMDISP